MTYPDYHDFFFQDILRVDGDPANDWQAVLESLPAKGYGTNPKPGEVQPVDAPKHGITIMLDSGGNARGRIWLPTDTPDALGYFTYEVQVIADGPTPGSFVWAWQERGGPPARPFSGAQPGPEPTPPHDPLALLEQRIAALEAVAVRNGERVSLSTVDETHYLYAEGGGGGDVSASMDLPADETMFRVWRRGA